MFLFEDSLKFRIKDTELLNCLSNKDRQGRVQYSVYDYGIDICHLALYNGNKGGVIMETTFDKFGRVVIPKGIRDNLGLRSGEGLEIEKSENEIILRPLGRLPIYMVKTGYWYFQGLPRVIL